MTLSKNAISREWFFLVLLLTVGLVFAPVLFYQGTTTSLWDDSTFSIAVFDKYWDDFVKYHDFAKVWWKILTPYFVFQFVRALFWSGRKLKIGKGDAVRVRRRKRGDWLGGNQFAPSPGANAHQRQ
jgi:hypothetical protein